MTTNASPPDFWLETALTLYRYARRWATGQSSQPEDAVIYDACLTVINNLYPTSGIETTSAQTDRYSRYGHEPYTTNFTLPLTVEDAVMLLHRFARRYTNGRGSYTAAMVNTSAKEIIEHGVSLDPTQESDGTIWAADGADGQHDGLTTEQRTEALAALGRKPPPVPGHLSDP